MLSVTMKLTPQLLTDRPTATAAPPDLGKVVTLCVRITHLELNTLSAEIKMTVEVEAE